MTKTAAAGGSPFGRCLFSRAIALLFLAATGPAWAYGPLTHAYIALQIYPDAPPQLLYGAMAADMNSFNGGNEAVASAMKTLTHFNAQLLAPSPFQLGMLTHNSTWGADSYAHAYFHIPTDKLYPMRLFEQLSTETGISMNDAEDMIETLMDVVICRDLGEPFITRVKQAIESAGPAEEQAVVDAFTIPLSQKVPELSPERTQTLLRTMFQCDKRTLRATANLLSLRFESLTQLAPALLAPAFHINMAKAEQCTRRAFELCTGWRPNLDAQAQAIAAHTKPN